MAGCLIVVGAIVALLIFARSLRRGSRVPPVVYAIPVLPVASLMLALLPRRADGAGSLIAAPTLGRSGRIVVDAAESELLHRRVVVHQLDPARAAEVDERHRRLADAGHLLDAAEPVLVVVDAVARLQRQQRPLAGRRLRAGDGRGVPNRPAPLTGALNDGRGVGAPPVDEVLRDLAQEPRFRVQHRLAPRRADSWPG